MPLPLSPISPVEENNGLNSIFQLLRRSAGVDFTHYRKTTILRRIQRRMMVHKIERINDYVRYLQTNPAEINALYQDMLINVTSFFRNPKTFDALKTTVFPSLMKNRDAGRQHPRLDSRLRLRRGNLFGGHRLARISR